MSAQPEPERVKVSLEDIKDVEGFCVDVLKRLPPGMFFQTDEREDELQNALRYLYESHEKWDREITPSFAAHVRFQLRNYYVRGRLPARREREARETPARKDDVASIDTADDTADRSFWEAEQRIYAEQVLSVPGLSDFDQQMLRGVLDGASRAQLARKLAVTDSTIDAHLVRLQPKFREFLGFC